MLSVYTLSLSIMGHRTSTAPACSKRRKHQRASNTATDSNSAASESHMDAPVQMAVALPLTFDASGLPHAQATEMQATDMQAQDADLLGEWRSQKAHLEDALRDLERKQASIRRKGDSDVAALDAEMASLDARKAMLAEQRRKCETETQEAIANIQGEKDTTSRSLEFYQISLTHAESHMSSVS